MVTSTTNLLIPSSPQGWCCCLATRSVQHRRTPRGVGLLWSEVPCDSRATVLQLPMSFTLQILYGRLPLATGWPQNLPFSCYFSREEMSHLCFCSTFIITVQTTRRCYSLVYCQLPSSAKRRIPPKEGNVGEIVLFSANLSTSSSAKRLWIWFEGWRSLYFTVWETGKSCLQVSPISNGASTARPAWGWPIRRKGVLTESRFKMEKCPQRIMLAKRFDLK